MGMATMSSTRTETALPKSPGKGVQALLQDARIDAAHSVGQDMVLMPAAVPDSGVELDVESATSGLAENLPVQPIDELPEDDLAGEGLQKQAEQLAHFLRQRQRELDHREAQLNAELAQLETDLRRERLCLSEREAEHEQHRLELDVREKEILERLERLAAADAVLKRKARATREQAGPCAGQPLEKVQAAQKHAEQNDRRQRELEKAENRLAQAQGEIRNFREQLTAQFRELREEIHRERQHLVARQRQALADLEKKRRVLEERGKSVDQCRAGLLELRGELQRMHRETLEIHLATEELWLKLSGSAPAAALTRSLGRIRKRLADQYRLANAELIKRKEEMESVRDQLVEQYRKLAGQKQEFGRRLEAEQKESQRQAAEMTAREQALLQQQTRFEEESQRWQVERMQYEQEIRLLRLQLARQGEQTANA